MDSLKPSTVRRADISRILFLENYWSKCKHALGPEDVTMGTLTLSLSTWAWRAIVRRAVSQESGDGIGYPPGQGYWDAADFSADLCTFLRDSGTPIFEAPKCRKKICGKSAQKCARKSAHQKSAQKSAHAKCAQKSARQKSAQEFGWKMEARKNTKNICAKLTQNPSPNLSQVHHGP